MLKFLLKRKVGNIEEAARKLAFANACKCTLWSYGEYDIDARLLVMVVQTATDEEREKLKSRPQFIQALKELPAKHSWPDEACADVVFEIESQQTVDRDFAGNWQQRFT